MANLHEGHCDLTQKRLLQEHLPNIFLFSCGMNQPLLLIRMTKDCCFKTADVSFLILAFKSLSWPPLLECAHILLQQTHPIALQFCSQTNFILENLRVS